MTGVRRRLSPGGRLAFAGLVLALLCACASGPRPEPVCARESQAASPQERLLVSIARETLDATIGGATVDLNDGRFVRIGEPFVAVSQAGGIALPQDSACARLVRELDFFIRAHPELLAEDGPRYYLGTWADPEYGKIWIDVTLLIPYGDEAERARALQRANEIGWRSGQRRLFDLGRGVDLEVTAPAGSRTPGAP